MNGPDTPLRPDALDELLSADIDGELERAASDRGLTLADARTALATPAAAARRAALVRARDLVSPAVQLDPADTDRLVAGALEGAREQKELETARRQRNRFDVARRVTLAAAAIVVVFGTIALLSRGSTSSSSKASGTADSAAGPTTVPETPPADLGDVSTRQALQSKVRGRLQHRASAPVPESVAAPEYQSDAGAKAAFDGPLTTRSLALLSLEAPQGQRGLVVPRATASERAAGTVRPTRTDCVDRLVQGGRVPPVVAFSGSGTSDGQPVYVAAFRSATGYDVYVLRATDCSVLRRAAV